MNFYTSISDYYDHIFPLNKVQLQFTEQRINVDGEILEIGCATGSLLLSLNNGKRILNGIDLDEVMINIARSKIKDKKLKATLTILDMKNLTLSYEKESLDAIIIYGNTLVHLLTLQEIESVISDVYIILKPGGSFLIQIINYDRIVTRKIQKLPTINNEFIEFKRNYTLLKEGLIRFDTTLKIKNTEINNSIKLLPMMQKDLDKILLNCNFKNISYFGSFKEDCYDSDSYALIAAAKK